MSPDPKIITLSDGRKVAVKWSSRAAYRVDTLKPRPSLEQARSGGSDGFAFIVAYLWAMLWDERDRRRYASPEDLAEQVDPARKDMDRLWHAVFLDAFGIDLDAPEQVATPAATKDEPVGGGSPAPLAGPTSQPSPWSNTE